MYFVQRFHIFCVFPNIVVLEPSRDPKATLCQRASQWISKWPRKTRTDKQINRQTDISSFIFCIDERYCSAVSIPIIKLLMSVYLFICLYAFFSAISKPTGTPFGTKLPLGPGMVLKQQYLGKPDKCGYSVPKKPLLYILSK